MLSRNTSGEFMIRYCKSCLYLDTKPQLKFDEHECAMLVDVQGKGKD